MKLVYLGASSVGSEQNAAAELVPALVAVPVPGRGRAAKPRQLEMPTQLVGQPCARGSGACARARASCLVQKHAHTHTCAAAVCTYSKTAEHRRIGSFDADNGRRP